MGVLYRIKSENFWAAAGAGAVNQWLHIDAGFTGRVTLVPAQASTNAIKPIILQNVVVNTSGASGVTTVSDSARGTIATLKASVNEKDYHYNIPLRGSLVVDNTSASDLTVVYIRD
jgi:hypothetical protein